MGGMQTLKSQNLSRTLSEDEIRKARYVQLAYDQLTRDTVAYKSQIKSLQSQILSFNTSVTSFQQTLDNTNSELETCYLDKSRLYGTIEEKDETIGKLQAKLKLGRYVIPITFGAGVIGGIWLTSKL